MKKSMLYHDQDWEKNPQSPNNVCDNMGQKSKLQQHANFTSFQRDR